MARRSKDPDLEVKALFEAARIAPQCLAEAYELLVPIPRHPTRDTALARVARGTLVAPDQPGWRRAKSPLGKPLEYSFALDHNVIPSKTVGWNVLGVDCREQVTI